MFARFDVIGSFMYGPRDGRNRGLVEDVVDSLDRGSRHREIGQVALHELDTREVRQVLAFPGDQTVDDADALATLNEFPLVRVRTDETGTAGHEIVRHIQ